MKKRTQTMAALLVGTMLFGMLTGCGESSKTTKKQSKKKNKAKEEVEEVIDEDEEEKAREEDDLDEDEKASQDEEKHDEEETVREKEDDDSEETFGEADYEDEKYIIDFFQEDFAENGKFISVSRISGNEIFGLTSEGNLYILGNDEPTLITNIHDAVELRYVNDYGALAVLSDGSYVYASILLSMHPESEPVHFSCPGRILMVTEQYVCFEEDGQYKLMDFETSKVHELKFYHNPGYPNSEPKSLAEMEELHPSQAYGLHDIYVRFDDNNLYSTKIGWTNETGEMEYYLAVSDQEYIDHDTVYGRITEEIKDVSVFSRDPIVFCENCVFFEGSGAYRGEAYGEPARYDYPDGVTYEDIDEISLGRDPNIMIKTHDNRYYMFYRVDQEFKEQRILNKYHANVVDFAEDVVLMDNGKLYRFATV